MKNIVFKWNLNEKKYIQWNQGKRRHMQTHHEHMCLLYFNSHVHYLYPNPNVIIILTITIIRKQREKKESKKKLQQNEKKLRIIRIINYKENGYWMLFV